ncbi:MAG: hypothetical protein M1833_005056 [Piccolia ochrophora]|nr:MAG: hypothetical protein M1833_005056 [Piccolia ochrophora]
MPAMLEDPAKAAIFRISGEPPYPTPNDPQLPPQLVCRQVTLRDRVTVATCVPFSSVDQVPPKLLAYLCDQFGREIEKGDTYPMLEPMSLSAFGPYWFANFGAVMLMGEIDVPEDVQEGQDWSAECLGSFYIKPNYPGRSSHVCNGGFLVTDAARNRGVGRLMGEVYLEWAPMLGYTYSVFNLVYETNVASIRIWDALGFKRIGRVKGCGNLKSYPDELIDAFIYGRDLGPEGEDFVTEERFDKIKFYLKHGKYPNGADRAEKSRLRSAATHYKLLNGDKLMLKDKEVISDPQQQYEIARMVHMQHHGGINKTTAAIADKYHWVRIKETVGMVIRNCADCKELAKAPVVRSEGPSTRRQNGNGDGHDRSPSLTSTGVSAAGRAFGTPNAESRVENVRYCPSRTVFQTDESNGSKPAQQRSTTEPESPSRLYEPLSEYQDIPVDPQLVEDMRQHLTQYNQSTSNDPSPSPFDLQATNQQVPRQEDHEAHFTSDTSQALDETTNDSIMRDPASPSSDSLAAQAAMEAAMAAQEALSGLGKESDLDYEQHG